MTKDKLEAMEILNRDDIPCGPILSMKELSEQPSLRETGTIVEVDHPTRGKYLSVGMPVKLSDSPAEVKRSPLLGEHTDEILRDVLRFDAQKMAEIKASGALARRSRWRRTSGPGPARCRARRVGRQLRIFTLRPLPAYVRGPSPIG